MARHPSSRTQQVVGGQKPNTAPPVVQAPGRQRTGNPLPQPIGLLGILRSLRPPVGPPTPKVAPTNTSTVRGGSGAVQTVGGGVTKQAVGPTSELAPPVTKAPGQNAALLQELRSMGRPQRDTAFTRAPRTGGAGKRTSRGTKTSRISPKNTLTSRRPRQAGGNDPFGAALSRLRKGRFTSDNPTELRQRVAAIRSSF